MAGDPFPKLLLLRSLIIWSNLFASKKFPYIFDVVGGITLLEVLLFENELSWILVIDDDYWPFIPIIGLETYILLGF
jgi:hypothetical protein